MPPDPRQAEAPDTGLLAALKECIADQGLKALAKSHADSIHASAIGAAIWGAFRYDKLAGLGQLPTCLREAGVSLPPPEVVRRAGRRRQEAS